MHPKRSICRLLVPVMALATPIGTALSWDSPVSAAQPGVAAPLPAVDSVPCSGALAPGSAPVYHVANSVIGVWLRGEPRSATPNKENGPMDGDAFRLLGQVAGDPMGVRSNTVWDYVQLVADGRYGYLPEAWTDTPVAANVYMSNVPRCGAAAANPAPVAARKFNGDAAASWAQANVNTAPSFEEDCTWFASQALWQGGLPTSSTWTGKSWDWNQQASVKHYPGPTQTAAYAPYLVKYLVDNGLATKRQLSWSVNDVPDAQLGDLIAYDWQNDGIIDHLMVVTKLEGARPFVTGHTNAVLNQYWTWSSYYGWWIESSYSNPVAYLIHITY